ncbi:uncharacterized protein CLUP02_10463 [Colletotrichum lupini]|uniref:Uncharacterized protein n=1 Tax=Colletotrichum lupini TaxID=145971 RepID=A0A9Q8WJD7_9PEZI|nr:uncharacterized protein CLUP02_10463 [Colletotrichum lupini]UQC84967.1 hypothetical protein CLUP02_10463 [Colletotrichum lupini]
MDRISNHADTFPIPPLPSGIWYGNPELGIWARLPNPTRGPFSNLPLSMSPRLSAFFGRRASLRHDRSYPASQGTTTTRSSLSSQERRTLVCTRRDGRSWVGIVKLFNARRVVDLAQAQRSPILSNQAKEYLRHSTDTAGGHNRGSVVGQLLFPAEPQGEGGEPSINHSRALEAMERNDSPLHQRDKDEGKKEEGMANGGFGREMEANRSDLREDARKGKLRQLTCHKVSTGAHRELNKPPPHARGKEGVRCTSPVVGGLEKQPILQKSRRWGKMHTSYTPPTPTRNCIGIARIARTHVLGIKMLSVMLVCTTTHGGAYSTDHASSVPGQARSVKVSYGRSIVNCLNHSNLTILALFCLVVMAVVLSSCFLCNAEVVTFKDGCGMENKQREGKFTLPLVTHSRTTSHEHRYEQADYPSLRSRAPPLSRYPSTSHTLLFLLSFCPSLYLLCNSCLTLPTLHAAESADGATARWTGPASHRHPPSLFFPLFPNFPKSNMRSPCQAPRRLVAFPPCESIQSEDCQYYPYLPSAYSLNERYEQVPTHSLTDTFYLYKCICVSWADQKSFEEGKKTSHHGESNSDAAWVCQVLGSYIHQIRSETMTSNEIWRGISSAPENRAATTRIQTTHHPPTYPHTPFLEKALANREGPCNSSSLSIDTFSYESHSILHRQYAREYVHGIRTLYHGTRISGPFRGKSELSQGPSLFPAANNNKRISKSAYTNPLHHIYRDIPYISRKYGSKGPPVRVWKKPKTSRQSKSRLLMKNFPPKPASHRHPPSRPCPNCRQDRKRRLFVALFWGSEVTPRGTGGPDVDCFWSLLTSKHSIAQNQVQHLLSPVLHRRPFSSTTAYPFICSAHRVFILMALLCHSVDDGVYFLLSISPPTSVSTPPGTCHVIHVIDFHVVGEEKNVAQIILETSIFETSSLGSSDFLNPPPPPPGGISPCMATRGFQAPIPISQECVVTVVKCQKYDSDIVVYFSFPPPRRLIGTLHVFMTCAFSLVPRRKTPSLLPFADKEEVVEGNDKTFALVTIDCRSAVARSKGVSCGVLFV